MQMYARQVPGNSSYSNRRSGPKDHREGCHEDHQTGPTKYCGNPATVRQPYCGCEAAIHAMNNIFLDKNREAMGSSSNGHVRN